MNYEMRNCQCTWRCFPPFSCSLRPFSLFTPNNNNNNNNNNFFFSFSFHSFTTQCLCSPQHPISLSLSDPMLLTLFFLLPIPPHSHLSSDPLADFTPILQFNFPITLAPSLPPSPMLSGLRLSLHLPIWYSISFPSFLFSYQFLYLDLFNLFNVAWILHNVFFDFEKLSNFCLI